MDEKPWPPELTREQLKSQLVACNDQRRVDYQRISELHEQMDDVRELSSQMHEKHRGRIAILVKALEWVKSQLEIIQRQSYEVLTPHGRGALRFDSELAAIEEALKI